MPLSNLGDTVISIVLFFSLVTATFEVLQGIPVQDLWTIYLLVKTTTHAETTQAQTELGDGAIGASLLYQWPPRMLLW